MKTMPATPDKALLSVRNLAYSLDDRSLWQGVQMSVYPGERWAVAGPSGSGKTLLLRALAGLIPHVTGEIYFARKSLALWPMPAYRAQVVYVPQRPMLPDGRVQEVLAGALKLRANRGKPLRTDTVRTRLERLKMDQSLLMQCTGNLSGGESQIVGTLRALMIEPAILLLDEPTASLDSTRAAALEKLVGDWLADGEQRAFLWTSHDRAQLERVSNRMLMLDGGDCRRHA